MMTNDISIAHYQENNGIIEQQSLFKWQKGSDFTQNTYTRGKLIAKIGLYWTIYIHSKTLWEKTLNNPTKFKYSNYYMQVMIMQEKKIYIHLALVSLQTTLFSNTLHHGEFLAEIVNTLQKLLHKECASPLSFCPHFQ